MKETVATFRQISCNFNFFINEILIVIVIPKYLNFAAFLKDLLGFYCCDFAPHYDEEALAFSVFTPRPTSLLASNYLVFIVFVFSLNKLALV